MQLMGAAQVASVKGHLSEAKTGKPVQNAEITVENTKLATTSSEDGSFYFNEIAPGNYLLVCKHISYQEQTIRVMLEEGAVKNIRISLLPSVLMLEEIVVDESNVDRDVRSLQHIPRITAKRADIDESSASDPGDFLRSISNISGIRKGGTGIDPVLRGFRFSQLNVQMNDGQKVEGGCPNRMDPVTAHIEIDDVERIDVYKGPYALKFGPSLGGVVHISTDEPVPFEKPGFRVVAMKGFESNWNGEKERLMVTAGTKKTAIVISGSQRDYGSYKDGNGNTVESSYYRYNYKASAGWFPSQFQKLLFSYESSAGRNVDFPALPMDERKDDSQFMSLEYQNNSFPNDKAIMKFKIYDSRVHHLMDNKERPFSDTVAAVSDIRATNRGMRVESNVMAGKGQITSGLDFEYISKDGTRTKNMIMQPNLPVKKEKLWNQAEYNNLGIFGEYMIKIKSTSLVLSARADFNEAGSDEISIMHPMAGEIYRYGTDSIKSGYTNISFSGGITREISKKLSISLALGRGMRSPDLTERFIILLPIGYDKFDYLGNPKLMPEINNQADITIRLADKGIGLFEATGFISYVNKYIGGTIIPPSQQKPLTTDVLGVKKFNNIGNATLRGFEVTYMTPERFRLKSKLGAGFTYGTLDKSYRYILNENGDVTGEEKISNDALTEIPPLEATLAIEYPLLNNRLIPKMTLRAVAAQDHVSKAQYEQASPGFMIMGFSFYYDITDVLSVSGGVHNIFDIAYYEHLNRNIIGSQSSLYEPGRRFFINLIFSL